MKRFYTLLSAFVLFCSGASAQRLQFGLRGGINTVSQHFDRAHVDNKTIAPGKAQIGYEAGAVLRLNISRHIHLQSELNYAFVNYDYKILNGPDRHLKIRTERLEIPVQLGLQFGALRLFGGAGFCVMQAGHSDNDNRLRVRFNDDDIAIMGGIGFNIKKFFFDFRLTGYPRSHVWHTFVSNGVSQRVKIDRHLVCCGSIGFFF